ncbi:zinc finger domain-containing protein [Streptomyces chartreusis]
MGRQYKQSCSRCHAGPGKPCVLAEGTDASKVRPFPHDERVQPILDERKARQQTNPTVVPRPWRYEVTCPHCAQGPESRCKSPGGPHRARVERAKEYTRLQKARSQ